MNFLSRKAKTGRSRSDGGEKSNNSDHSDSPVSSLLFEQGLEQHLPSSWDIGEVRNSNLQLDHDDYDYASVTIRNTAATSKFTIVANQAIPMSLLKKLAVSRQIEQDPFSNLHSNQPHTTRSVSRDGGRPDFATHPPGGLYPKVLPSSRNLEGTFDELQDLLLERLSHDSLYYFEIKINQLPPGAAACVGLVSQRLGTSGDENVPGEIRESIGLDSSGSLKVGGKIVESEVWLDGQKGVSIENYGEGDVIGCAVEISGLRRIMFTKNGKIIVPATRFNDLDMRKNPHSPAFGLSMQRNQVSFVSANFGVDRRQPLKWSQSEYLVCKLVAEGGASKLDVRSADSGQRLPQCHGTIQTTTTTASAAIRNTNTTDSHQADSRGHSSSFRGSNSPLSSGTTRNLARQNQTSTSLSPGTSGPNASGRRPSSHRLIEGEPPTITTAAAQRSQPLEGQGNVFGRRASSCLMDEGSTNDQFARPPATSQHHQHAARRDEGVNQGSRAYSRKTRHESASQEFLGLTSKISNDQDQDPFRSSAPESAFGRQRALSGEEKTAVDEQPGPGGTLSSSGALTPSEIEGMKENVRMLRSVCGDDTAVDPSVLESLLDCCKGDQQTVKVTLDKAMTNEDASVDLMELIGLNELVLDAIKLGEETVEATKRAAEVRRPRLKKKSSTTMDLDINGLIRKKDVFSLICILRAQSEQRLDAALALMEFARDGERPEEDGISLRDEIRSSGGMHSLLQVFRARSTSYELRVVAGMAVAYVLPSFVETSPSVGLKIVECLRFLSTSRPVSPNGVKISREMMFNASAMGVTAFWMNALEPMLHLGMSLDDESMERSDLRMMSSASGGLVAGGVFDQGQQTLELQELLEMTVSLIVHIEKNCESPLVNTGGTESNEALAMWRHTNVEQVCAVDVARPIAVREGLLPILVDWIKSKDREKVRPAVSALRYLTSIKDKYMAGWIHSQMVNEGALSEVVKLADDYNAGHDVRLAVAQILSSLCVAPHTRAAVVEARCMFYLIGFLYDHSDQASEEVALYAGRAITQLAAGAITRASVFGGGGADILDFVSPDKRDSLVDDIVNSGAIGSFIAIAMESDGQLRAMAVEAIRVLSEDRSPHRRTRLQFVEDGAAKALGRTLQNDVNCLRHARKNTRIETSEPTSQLFSRLLESNFMEIHDALCALANILEPIDERKSTSPDLNRTSSTFDSSQSILCLGCLQTAESGGLVSLLRISTMSLVIPEMVESSELALRSNALLREACRSLSSLSPLLLSDMVAKNGCAGWAGSVLNVFNEILTAAVSEGIDRVASKQELYSVLCGLDALAKSEPLKIRIVDKALSSIVQLKNSQVEQSDVANVAGQVFFSLGFAEDEIAVHVAGSNAGLLADWFCLQRSLIIQAMVRAEIKQMLARIWWRPFLETGGNGFHRQLSPEHNLLVPDILSEMNLFENFADDDDTAHKRALLAQQYKDIYDSLEVGDSALNDFSDDSEVFQDDVNLLAKQTYPFNDPRTEKQWILSHVRANHLLPPKEEEPLQISLSLAAHVEKFLDCCLPSRLLRNHVLPVFSFRPESSFNYRAILMPQRQYFSFRREREMVSRLCDIQPETLAFEDVHWTLGFANSTFAGEFSESLVQGLYLCPTIRGLSFACDVGFTSTVSLEENEGEDGNVLLAKLVGSLPPWIDFLTFKNIFHDRELRTLVAIIETMGKLSADEDCSNVEDLTTTRGKGRFWSFAVTHSPQVTPKVWHSFLSLLGRAPTANRVSVSPLSSLMFLDLSFNNLGDATCAIVLELVHDEGSGCKLEQLDLSGNRIGKGAKVVQVLRAYVEKQRYISTMNRKGWASPLRTLNLSSNNLGAGHADVEILSLLKYNGLGLKSLDLSNNGICDGDSDAEFSRLLVSSLCHNSDLCNLNLSGNKFSHQTIDEMLEGILASRGDSRLAFLGFDDNTPPITPSQRSSFEAFLVGTRAATLQRAMSDQVDYDKGDSLDKDWIQDLNIDQGAETQKNRIKAASKSEIGATKDMPESESGPRGDNMITVLFSAPLVFTDDQRQLRAFKKLDFDMERELMWQCMKEASRDIELSFDNATHDRLLAAMTKRCSCLHYSGHGHQMYLPFEDGSGGPNWFKVEDIQCLIARKGAAPFKFVFVSACHSGLAGETFASAGVPHVVCCQQKFELKDTAALAFTRQFYLSLAIGHTVKESFEQGCKAVRATPNLRNAENEMKKFLLLPKDGNHEVPIFNASPIPEWPKLKSDLDPRRSLRKSKSTPRIRNMYGAGTKQSELGVRNMMQEDPSPTPPQFFLGREVEMYLVLKAILGKRLVSVVGELGVGRSSIVCAVCHYINERASTIIAIEKIYFVKAKRGRRGDCCRGLLEQLQWKLVEAAKGNPPDRGADMEDMFEFICKSLKNEKALLVFDRMELLENSDDAQEFPMFLSSLFRGTKNVKVLLTGKRQLGIPSLGGQVESPIQLGPLNFGNTVRLFANLCPRLHTEGERYKLYQRLVTDYRQAELRPQDAGVEERTRAIFAVLGDGVPAKIEKAAYDISSDRLQDLLQSY